MATLRISGLRRIGLQAVDLEIPAASTLCLHGPSGSGKTLLLRAIADLDPNQGEVFLDNVARSSLPAHQWRRRVMYLPPESYWWDERVEPHCAHWPDNLLSALGFDRSVRQWEVQRLSSGERQRLSLVRMLAREPRALLLDEPTANLDPQNVLAVEQLIADYQRRWDAPIIWVSHDRAQRARVGTQQRRIEQGRLQ